MAVQANKVMGGAATGASAGAAAGPWGAVVGAVIGGIAGAMSGDGGEAAAQQAIKDAYATLAGIGMPPDLSGPIIMNQLQQGGILTPALEGMLQEEQYNASLVQDNAQTRAQLTSALEGVRSKAFGGLSPEQMANQQRLLQEVDAGTQSKFKGILQGQAMQGKSGSGDALASMLSAAQGGAQQGSQNALEIGAQGHRSQDAALRDYLQGLGALRSQDDSRGQFNASAQNVANQAKMQNAAARQRANVANVNAANKFNISRQQDVNDANVGIANNERIRQKNAERQFWLDKLNFASAKGNAQLGLGSQMQNWAQNSNQAFNDTLQGAGQLANTGINMYNDYKKNNRTYNDDVRDKWADDAEYYGQND